MTNEEYFINLEKIIHRYNELRKTGISLAKASLDKH